ncbi:hypothetical protein NITMOv2_0494 [Nitrospira moscoviensis]|uniref:Uncharacterized protein n=1 Tax=Nitrospira moscoviensis TaxID=42253 RepID=A0A0K2G7N1_NITMO|nr:hypothetical protein NITMOv2_0494 [Nitrospira moscoviensis]
MPIQNGTGASNGCHQRRASFGRHGPSFFFRERTPRCAARLRDRMTRRTTIQGPRPRRPVTRLTVTLPEPLLNRLRNTVYWVPQLTLARLVETALLLALYRLESDHGGPFPRRLRELKPGRPKAAQSCRQADTTPASFVASCLSGSVELIGHEPVRQAARRFFSPSPVSQGLPESPE